MRCHEVIHHWDYMIRQVKTEHRSMLLDYFASAYDGDGKFVGRAEGFHEKIFCMDCPDDGIGCGKCELVSDKYKQRRR